MAIGGSATEYRPTRAWKFIIRVLVAAAATNLPVVLMGRESQLKINTKQTSRTLEAILGEVHEIMKLEIDLSKLLWTGRQRLGGRVRRWWEDFVKKLIPQ